MPITGINSYLITAQEFENHWASVNAARSAPLVLPDGTAREDFVAQVAAMSAAFVAIVGAESSARTASAALGLGREAITPRMVQFGQAVRLYLGRTRFADAAPHTPNATAGEQRFKEATSTIAARWADINAATDLAPFAPPLLLPPDSNATPLAAGYTQSDFAAEAASLMAAFDADRLAGESATQKRRDRDALLPPVYAAMKTYREACLLLLPTDSPLRATLPRLTPTPGTTPPALSVSGAWDVQVLAARLAWDTTTARDVQKLQVRGCVGAYKNGDESVVADLEASATEWTGNWGLQSAGDAASFKVYVMTETGNEAGSKAVKIERALTPGPSPQ